VHLQAPTVVPLTERFVSTKLVPLSGTIAEASQVSLILEVLRLDISWNACDGGAPINCSDTLVVGDVERPKKTVDMICCHSMHLLGRYHS